METIDMTGLQGGGATRKTGSCCDLLKRHSGLAAKSVERKSKRDFMPLPGDPESINADNRLRLGGRSDEGGKIIPSSYRHPELDSGSIKIGKLR